MLTALILLLAALETECISNDNDIVVNSYRLWMKLNDTDFSYKGTVSVKFKTMLAPKKLYLNAMGLKVLSSNITVDGLFDFPHKLSSENNKFVVVEGLSPFFNLYHYTLSLEFEGHVSDGLDGFYKGNYADLQGNLWEYALTKFEPDKASFVFPCFDILKLRAPFQLTFTVPEKWTVISNTPSSKVESNEEGWKTITFLETPTMPIYTFAWLVFDNRTFTAVKTKSVGNITYSVYAQNELESAAEFAISVIPELVSKFESFVGIPYAQGNLVKLDCLAIPDLYSYGMESWGIVQFRDYKLLFDEATDTTEVLQDNFLLAAHEITHQWFGNLVTPSEWNFIWLSEGFARYLEYLLVDMIKPEWRLPEQFVTDVLHVAMNDDAPDREWHPLVPQSGGPFFDLITYGKGASILHMVSSFMGREAFQNGVRTFLNTCVNQSGLSNPDELYSSLSKYYGAGGSAPPLVKVLHKWTTSPGFPILNVRRVGDNLEFYQSKSDKTKEEFETWYIPIRVITEQPKSSPMDLFWIGGEADLTFPVKIEDMGKWYLVNPNQTVYSQVNYDENNWKAIKEDMLTNPQLNPLTRSQLVHDAFSLLDSEHLQEDVAFEFIDYLTEETDFIPWKTALRKLQGISVAFYSSKNIETWKWYVRSLIDNLVSSIDFTNLSDDDHPTKLHKTNVMKHACLYEHPICNETLQYYYNNDTALQGSPDMADALMCTMIKYGDTETWETLFTKYKESRLPGEKLMILLNLACTRNEYNLKRLVNETLEPSEVRKEFLTDMFIKVSSFPGGAEIAFRLLVESRDVILKKAKFVTVPSLFYTVLYGGVDSSLIQKLEEFNNENHIGINIDDAKKILKQRQIVEARVCKYLKCPYKVSSGVRLDLNLFIYLVAFSLLLFSLR
ncbi:thyrotropin-releasing hormone-degrading ectoenzyme-like [Cimex lectularius]|uniref:Aminopeptidase n=1 Tax=Cimex lectularius TaxID=79782 RepID=A0A8I6RYW4_CIMLE|nr:thyrotropin-releasing hormone-degrading ectoenzyme-like [Cimex lectularius]